MRLRRSILVGLWVPVAAVLGPVVALRHGLPQFLGGAIVVSIPLIVCYHWQHLDERAAPRRRFRWPAFAAGLVIGLGPTPTSYGQADALYVHRLAHVRQVVVTTTGCTRVKQGHVCWAKLSTLDGHSLPLAMYDLADGAKPSQRIAVRWDRLGYASPTPTAYPGTAEPFAGVTALVPTWVWAGLLALHLAGTGILVRRAYRRPTRL